MTEQKPGLINLNEIDGDTKTASSELDPDIQTKRDKLLKLKKRLANRAQVRKLKSLKAQLAKKVAGASKAEDQPIDHTEIPGMPPPPGSKPKKAKSAATPPPIPKDS